MAYLVCDVLAPGLVPQIGQGVVVLVAVIVRALLAGRARAPEGQQHQQVHPDVGVLAFLRQDDLVVATVDAVLEQSSWRSRPGVAPDAAVVSDVI
jgi:hypothetical protein